VYLSGKPGSWYGWPPHPPAPSLTPGPGPGLITPLLEHCKSHPKTHPSLGDIASRMNSQRDESDARVSLLSNIII